MYWNVLRLIRSFVLVKNHEWSINGVINIHAQNSLFTKQSILVHAYWSHGLVFTLFQCWSENNIVYIHYFLLNFKQYAIILTYENFFAPLPTQKWLYLNLQLTSLQGMRSKGIWVPLPLDLTNFQIVTFLNEFLYQFSTFFKIFPVINGWI